MLNKYPAVKNVLFPLIQVYVYQPQLNERFQRRSSFMNRFIDPTESKLSGQSFEKLIFSKSTRDLF